MYFKYQHNIKVNSRHVQTIRTRINEETEKPEIVFELVMDTDEVVWSFDNLKERDRVFEEIDSTEFEMFARNIFKDLQPLMATFIERAKKDLDPQEFWDPGKNAPDVLQPIWEVHRIEKKTGKIAILRETAEFLPPGDQSVPIALNLFGYQEQVIKGLQRDPKTSNPDPKSKFDYMVQKSPFH